MKSAAIALALLLTPAAAWAGFEGVNLAGHRAVYDLSLSRTDPSGVAAMRGRLALEFRNTCDGYTLSQRLRTEFVDSDGNPHFADFTVASWEAADGRAYRFNIRHESDSQPTEEWVGRARLGAAGQPGEAAFSKPPDMTMDLPPGTVFPSEHLAVLIRAARRGETVAPVKVFDGSAEDGVFEVGGFIGRPTPRDRPGSELLGAVRERPSWPVRLAYFPAEGKTDTPSYEIAFRLYDNGVSDDLVLDYGDYALKGVLTRFELFPDPGC